MSWNTMLKILGRKDANIPPRLHALISHFVECMTSKQCNPLKQLWDLSPDHHLMMVDNPNPGLQVTYAGSHYILTAKRDSNNDVPWLLVLDDAATVLKCLCWGHSGDCGASLLVWQAIQHSDSSREVSGTSSSVSISNDAWLASFITQANNL